MAPKKTVSFARVNEAGEKAIDKLDAKEFRERFCIPNDVSIGLVNEEAAMPTEKGEENVILFTKEQFNAGLRFPLPALFKEFLHFSQIPPIFIHPNVVRVLMGCSIINMLYSLDLTLLEVFFVYSLKKAKTDIFSVSAHLPSLQMVTELPDSTKGGAKGLVAVGGVWAGLSQHASRPFSPNYTLKIPGLELRGHLVDWVEKGSFACVCKLFEIDPKERAYKTLLSARNLIAVVREPQEYVINILPRKLAKDEIVPGEHYTVKELPLYQEAKEADAERRRKLLEDRDQKKTEGTIRKAPGQKRGPDSPSKKTPGKRRKLVKKHGKDVKEPTPPKEFPPPQTTYEGEVMIEEPVNAAPHSISSGPGRMSGLNHSGPSLAAAARLANVAEEAASINRPGNLNPDADAAETTPLEEAGAESQSQPFDDPDRLAIVPVKGPPSKKPRSTRDLRSGLLGRLEKRQQEIEVSCASAHDAHPDGGEVEMATETSAAPVIIPAEDVSGHMRPDEDVEVPDPGQELPSVSSSEEESADDAAPASPFSYAELEVKLKHITPDWKAIKPSAKITIYVFAFFVCVSAGEGPPRHGSTTRSFYSDAADCRLMRTFSSRRQEIENQLRLKMEEAEANLTAMREENEALRVELAEAKSREESTAGRLHEAESEAARLRDEVSQLRTEVSIEKKQKEDLQLRLDVQKEELEREFAVEREELAADYQQQVDDMFIFGYRCCMKKNGIKRDTPSIPPGEEKKLHEKPAP
ncbi:hypothetical protein CK203_002110 [Vitis vinifera]|uniref:Uncharacterized protein n=1 Tax=Vitis vinifera TaxID=29760 RepID=A0A438KJU2_VITVI|nr:hypothetical protein CK203_002110 [Vitis vinifera]